MICYRNERLVQKPRCRNNEFRDEEKLNLNFHSCGGSGSECRILKASKKNFDLKAFVAAEKVEL